MSDNQNNSRTLTSQFVGSLKSLSERWKAFLGYTQTDVFVPLNVEPDAVSGLLVDSGVEQTTINERKKTNVTLGDPTGESMVEEVVVEGMIATRTLTLPTTGSTFTIDYKTIAGEQQSTGLGFSEQQKTTVASYPQKQGQEYVAQYDFVAGYTIDRDAMGIALGNGQTTVSPFDFNKADVKTETIPVAALEAFVLSYPSTERIFLPEVLTAIAAVWDIVGGDGTYSETGTGVAAGSYCHLNLVATGRGSGTAGVLGEIIPSITHYWPHNVPVQDYFFFLPNNSSNADLLTKLTTLAGATVSAWPIFKLASETILVTSQKAVVTAEARAVWDVSLIDSGSGPSASEAISEGGGESYTFEHNVKAITLPPMVHGVINFSGDMTKTGTAIAGASAHEPGATGGGAASQVVTGTIFPTSLPATTPGGLPASGLYLLTTDATPFRWGWSTFRCRILDTSIL